MSDNHRVLRCVYFDPKTDNLIRVMSFWEKKSKSDVIIALIKDGLEARGIENTDEYIGAWREKKS